MFYSYVGDLKGGGWFVNNYVMIGGWYVDYEIFGLYVCNMGIIMFGRGFFLVVCMILGR